MFGTKNYKKIQHLPKSQKMESNVVGNQKSTNAIKKNSRKADLDVDANNEYFPDYSKRRKTIKATSESSSSEKFELLLSKIEEISQKLTFDVVSDPFKRKKLEEKSKRNKQKTSTKNKIGMNGPVEKFTFNKTPFFINGEMRDYQLDGLNWLISLRENNVNGILADEMGIGKTLQTISLLAYIKNFENNINEKENSLPFIIIVPLSILHIWEDEFKKWTNGMRVVVLYGNEKERRNIIKYKLVEGMYDVALTTYEMFSNSSEDLENIFWEYIIVDEIRYMKNEKTIFSKGIRRLKAKNKLLLTGTPLQTNLHELWALLNFLQPELFDSASDFETWFDSKKCKGNEGFFLQKLEQIIKPFVLRRTKNDVESGLVPKKEITLFVGLSNIQKDIYDKMLTRDPEIFVNGRVVTSSTNNIMQQLRKAVSHPYLLPGIKPGPVHVEGEHIIKSSGKLDALDKLLFTLKCRGSRVLIFTEFTGSLDILEEYMHWRNYSYHRFDGSTSHIERQQYIDEYQSPNSKTFAFLLSTRAGGLGITLTAADVVIFYDINWNPLLDLQAADRVHRIGQTKEIKIFRLIAEGTIDEKVYKIAKKKLHLNDIIIQKSRINEINKEMYENYIVEAIRSSPDNYNIDNIDQNQFIDEIEDIVDDSSKKFEMLKEEFHKVSTSQNDSFCEDFEKTTEHDTIYKFDGINYKALKKLKKENNTFEKNNKKQELCDSQDLNGKREVEEKISFRRKKNSSFPPNYLPYKNYFLCYPEYINLADKYVAYYRKCQNFSFIQNCNVEVSEDDIKKQRIIDNAKPLTKKEIEKMNKLKKDAFFSNWNQKDFVKMKNLLSSNGMDFEKIHQSLPNYDINEIKSYAKRLPEYAYENNMKSFLQKFQKAEENREKRVKYIQYIDKLYNEAHGRPLNVNISEKIFHKKLHGVTHDYNLELDKCIFYCCISEIKKNNIDIGEITGETIYSIITLEFLNRLNRVVKSFQSYKLDSITVVQRFLNILQYIENWIELESKSKIQ